MTEWSCSTSTQSDFNAQREEEEEEDKETKEIKTTLFTKSFLQNKSRRRTKTAKMLERS